MDKQQNITAAVNEDEEIDLLELFSIYLSKLPWIVAALIIGAVVAGVWTYYTFVPTYTASAKLYMVSASSGSAVDLTDLSIGTSLSKDYVELMKIRPIYEDVVEELDLPYTYVELQNMVTVSNVSDTRVVTVSAESEDPEEACDIANAVAQKAVDYLPELMEASAPNIAETAIVPTSPTSPSLMKNTLLGALIGAVLVMAVLTVRYLLDDTLKTSDDIEKEFGIIPLTVIPESELAKENSKSKKRGKRKK
jgi:capsular polysaccharide biosynthesis protein